MGLCMTQLHSPTFTPLYNIREAYVSQAIFHIYLDKLYLNIATENEPFENILFDTHDSAGIIPTEIIHQILGNKPTYVKTNYRDQIHLYIKIQNLLLSSIHISHSNTSDLNTINVEGQKYEDPVTGHYQL
ncbi:hypothetical protein PFDG_04967 [Plasmodium falciparum Dd2]|uniref:Uncharacterized protein n=1 Tax=Plasmodium falciparum (isolate Dd2) TaxID=57267 RepID=A0A0L7M9E6_PLAF4|nr:hypothetical protein PFDG_04967 [Plasmodium falciparum Dd2]